MSQLQNAIFSSIEPTHATFQHDGLSATITGSTTDVFVVEIDRKILYKQKACMADYHLNDELVRLSNCKQFPLSMVRLVYALQRAVFLCEPPEEENIASGEHGGDGAADNEAEGEGGGQRGGRRNAGKKKRRTLIEQPMFRGPNGDILDRVEEYVETVLADEDESVLGWRLWFVVNDPSFNLDRALVSEFHWNREELKMVRFGASIQGKTQELYVVDQVDWVTRVANYYTMSSDIRVKFNKLNPRNELHYSLDSPENMASCVNLFNPMNTLVESIFADTARPEYLNPDEYIDATQIRFPHGAIYVPRAERHPDFFHHVMLTENAMTRRPLLRLNPDHALKVIQEQRERVQLMRLLTSNDGNVLTQVLEANVADHTAFVQHQLLLERHILEASITASEEAIAQLITELDQERSLVAQRMDTWRHSLETRERMNILFTSPDALSPGYAACVRWVIDQKNEAAKMGKRWSAMRTRYAPLDPELSVFAHFITRELFIYEHVVGSFAMHQELLFLMIHRLNSFDVRRERLKTNIVFIGPAAAGKSKQLAFLKDCSVPDWYRDITLETKKAYATDANFDQLGFMHDELGDQYLGTGDNQEGSSLIKTMLSEKKIVTNTIDPETRKTRTHTALMDIQMFACTNADKSTIPPPLATRFLITEVNQYRRPGVDISLKESELTSDVRDADAYLRFREEMRVVQCMACFTDMLIATKILPQIDMTAANLYLAAITGELLQHGIVIEPRMRTQIENCVRDCAMYEAVRRVFSTTEVFDDPNREFQYTDVLETLPYLFATEQHVVFTLTHMKNIVVDSSREIVLEALVKMTQDAKVPTFLGTGMDANGRPQYDFNYFFLDIGLVQADSDKILHNLAKKVNDVLKQTAQTVLHLPQIKSILRTLSCEALSFNKKYVDESTCDNSGQSENQLLLKVETEAGKTGVSISRLFMEQVKTMQTKQMDVMLMAIDKLRTRDTPRRRLVTGVTMRSNSKMYPHFVQMYEQTPIPSKPTLARNLQYRAPGYGECMDGKERVNAHNNPLIPLNRSIECEYYDEFCRTHRIPQRPAHFPVDLGGSLRKEGVEARRYPDWYVKDAERKQKSSVVSSGQSSSSSGDAKKRVRCQDGEEEDSEVDARNGWSLSKKRRRGPISTEEAEEEEEVH